jgi:pimeloyl-ACP methyl ester carboxylesterase
VSTAVAADGTLLEYRVAGRRDGPPLLALQGLGADHRGWIAQRRALGARYRLILVDNRGVGGSGRPPGPYDLEVMAADAVAVLDAEGLDDAHVIGASMGGVLAQILATRHASRVRSITLACTACRHHTWRRELLAQWREVAVTEGMAALAPVAARWLVGPRTLRRVRSALDLVAPLALNVAPGPFAAQVDAILALDDDLRFELASVRVPTLVLTGTQDLLTPFGDAEEIAELVPGARLAALRGAAHGFMVEQAGTFNRTVVDFLDEVVARGPHLAASA